MSPTEPHWYILGAGAIGTLFAALLQDAGARVTLLVRPGSQRDSGWILERDGQTTPRTTATQALDATTPVRRLLVVTKAFQAEAALAAVAPRLCDDAAIVLLHNGMGPQQRIARRFEALAVYAGTTTEGAWRRHPGHTVHAGVGESWFGPLNDLARALGPEAVSPLAGRLPRCGYDPAVTDRLWQKLAINGAINGLTALHDCRNGELVARPELRARMEALCAETEQLCRRLGQRLFPVPLMAQALAVAQATAANYSSMLQDVRAGRTTEFHQINGYLIEQGARLGLPMAAHRTLAEQLSARGVQWATA